MFSYTLLIICKNNAIFKLIVTQMSYPPGHFIGALVINRSKFGKFSNNQKSDCFVKKSLRCKYNSIICVDANVSLNPIIPSSFILLSKT